MIAGQAKSVAYSQDVSRSFLVETADYTELEDTMAVAISVYEELSPSEEEGTDLHTTILGTTGLLWGHKGYFSRALPYVRECNKIQVEREDKNWNSLCWSEVNLGNVLASAGQYDEALECQLKAEEARKKIGGDDVIKPNGVLQQNIGRCYTFLGQFDKAQQRLQSALQEFEGSKNWAMLALYVQPFALLTKAHFKWFEGQRPTHTFS